MTKQVLGLVGGILGALYATGYLVAAGHARVLGLPVRSTDPAPLLTAAWEFVVRGSVIFVLRVIDTLSIGRVAAFAIAALVLVGAKREVWPRLRPRIRTLAGNRAWAGASGLLAVAIALVLSVQVWHVVANVIPTSAVSSLLFVQSVRSPFSGSSRGYFDARWEAVQTDLLGDGTRGNTRQLSRRYVVHVLIALGTGLAAALIWRAARTSRTSLRVAAVAPAAMAAFLLLYTPLCYGALLKSYQYPVVNIIGANAHQDHDDLAAEFKQALSHARFLLDTTADDLYLFDPKTKEMHIVTRDQVAMIKILAEDFVFRME